MLKLDVSNRVATLLLDRPPVNAVNDAFLDRFDVVLHEIKDADPALVVVKGSGRHFSAGGDIKQMVSAPDSAITTVTWREMPDPEPVMTARCPLRSMFISLPFPNECSQTLLRLFGGVQSFLFE